MKPRRPAPASVLRWALAHVDGLTARRPAPVVAQLPLPLSPVAPKDPQP